VSFALTLIAIVIVVAIAATAVAAAVREQRRRRLRAPLGAEYDRLVKEYGSRQAADEELARRRREHDRLDLQPISPEGRQQFAAAWEHVQAGFLDDPAVALDGAARLVGAVLDARGYPGDDPDERMALASVEHGPVLGDLRAAESVVERARSGQDGVSTEAMRVGVQQYRTVLYDLIGVSEPETRDATVRARQEVQA
jgi:hypothetical protein